MASLSKKISDGKQSFRLVFTAGGKRRTLYLGGIRESSANKMKGRVEDLVTAAKLTIKLEDASLVWLQTVDLSIVDKLESFGLIVSPETKVIVEDRRNADVDSDQTITLLAFCQWYIKQRKSDCEKSTIRKITASLNQLCDYCREHETIESVNDLDAPMAFRFQLHRQSTKAEATVAKDVKIAKTAFSYGVKAGKIKANPFKNLKAGSDVNLDGAYIVPISDHEKLIDACPNSDWRTILALARLGGLRCPSELSNLKWTDVNWGAGTVRLTSPKTKRYGKAERTIPLFKRLEEALGDHFELTGEISEYVITFEPLRRRGASLSTRFHRISVAAGVPKIQNPFRNMRLSAANDVSRLPGITPKNMVDWFGHDMKTALKHYHRTTQQDFDQALAVDPFRDSVIARALTNSRDLQSNAQSNARTPETGGEWKSTNAKTPVIKRLPEHAKAKYDPYGTRTRVAGVKGRSPRPLDEGAVLVMPPLSAEPRRN